jgi:hypothetical protein
MDNFGKVGICLLVGCVIGLALIVLVGQLNDSQAARTRAEAELVRAETDRVRAESTAFQERYILFATTIVTLMSGVTFQDVLLLGLCIAVGFLAGWLRKGGAARL